MLFIWSFGHFFGPLVLYLFGPPDSVLCTSSLHRDLSPNSRARTQIDQDLINKRIRLLGYGTRLRALYCVLEFLGRFPILAHETALENAEDATLIEFLQAMC